MGIPNKISPLTGGDILPRGYLPAEFLESDGTTAVIDSQIIPDFETGVYVKMHALNTSGTFYYLGTQNNSGLPSIWITTSSNALSIRYNKDYFSINSLKDTAFKAKINWLNSKIAETSLGQHELTQEGESSWLYHLTFFRATYKANNRYDNGAQSRFYYIKMSQGSEIVRDMVPCISPTGEPCMYDNATKQPFKNAATGAFIVGMTVSQARYLCQLPIVASGALTVSLPWEAQWDTGVQNALSIAAARGWTITVQYRDPEVATANIPISFVESNADSLIWFTAPTPATSAEIELDIQYTQTRESYQAACGIAGHTGNWVAVDGTHYMLYSAIEGTNVLERSVILYKWYATPDSTVEGQSSLSVQGTTTTSFARNTTEATGVAMLNYDNGGWNPYYSYARVWSLRAKVGDWEVKGTPRLTTKGVPIMYDVDSKTEYPPTKGNNFIAGFDTAIQARNLAHLPDVTAETDAAKKSLTVSLPWDAQWDAIVQAALQVVTDRDWTITVQYRDPEPITTYMPISFVETNASSGMSYKSVTVTSSTGFKTEYMHTALNSPGSEVFYATDNKGNWMIPPRPDGKLAYWGTKTVRNLPVQVGKWLKVKMNYLNDSKLILNGEVRTLPDIGDITFGTLLILRGKQKLKFLYITQGNKKSNKLVPAIDNLGQVCLYDEVLKETIKSTSTQVIAGFDTVAQARNISKLPVTESGALTVSFPWEAQFDEGVQSALSIAATRGWTITIQYRAPEPTAENMPIGFLERTAASNENSINTGFFINGLTEFVCRFSCQNKASAAVFGAREAWTTNMFELCIDLNYIQMRYYNNAANRAQNNPDAVQEVSYIGSTLLINDNSYTIARTDFDIQAPMRIMACSESNGGTVDGGFIGRVYYLKIDTEGEIHEFIPALDSNGIPCMYDSVSAQNFYNSGTVAYIAGFNTVEQALNLAKLPDVTAETDTAKKSLTVSLPWEAQLVSTNVPAALQIAADRGWTITVQYRELEADNAYYNKYAECVTVDDMIAVNPTYQNDLTVDGEWLYPLTNQQDFSDGYKWWRENRNIKRAVLSTNATTLKHIFFYCSLLHVEVDAPYCTHLDTTFCSRVLLTAKCNLPSLIDGHYGFYDFKGTEFNAEFPQMTQASHMFYGSINLTRALIKMPSLSSGSNLLSGSKLDRESVVYILDNIPAHTSGTHYLTIGIHTDLQTDEEVTTAIANAEAKGWTVTVQWNGTASAAAASVSTFGLRSPAIYAKLGTMEHPDGTIKNVLDWGHYVTNWEENGYQEFSSIEEAEEYFNINQTEEL